MAERDLPSGRHPWSLSDLPWQLALELKSAKKGAPHSKFLARLIAMIRQTKNKNVSWVSVARWGDFSAPCGTRGEQVEVCFNNSVLCSGQTTNDFRDFMVYVEIM